MNKEVRRTKQVLFASARKKYSLFYEEQISLKGKSVGAIAEDYRFESCTVLFIF